MGQKKQQQFDRHPEKDFELKRPKRYKVILINDDYTTMDFVILILEKFFGKSYDEAYLLMMKVHHEGSAICGIYSFEVAESKVVQVERYCKEHEQPLQIGCEEEER